MRPVPSSVSPFALAVGLCLAWATPSTAAGPDAVAVAAARQRAVNFLKTTQADEGNWTGKDSVGITGVITIGLLDAGLSADDPAVAKALAFLKSHSRPDGGIYAEGSNHRNYETCLTLLALTKANTDGRFTPSIRKAEDFLKDLQWDEGEGLESSDIAYGGAGYGGSSRPDLSNTQFFLEALKSAGVKEDDPAMQKALVFVSRTQNRESEFNTTPFAAKINDGGFFYTPAAGGRSVAGTTPDGGLRSYGSMTYAGLKSMIYCGLEPGDPRVDAAADWARQHYSVTENPGLGEQGLYYYYQTFAKALDVLGEDQFTDADGTPHDWRADLTGELLRRQKPNGSWVNDADRFYEGDPHLVTGYALIALRSAVPAE